MFEGIISFFKKFAKSEEANINSKDTAKERLHLVLMQDRANVSADFLEMMKQEIIEVIKKYIEVDEKEIDVKLTNKTNDDGSIGAPALYANIPIVNVKNENKNKEEKKVESIQKQENKIEQKDEKEKQILEKKEEKKIENENKNQENRIQKKEKDVKVEIEENSKNVDNKVKEDNQNKNVVKDKKDNQAKPVTSKKKKK